MEAEEKQLPMTEPLSLCCDWTVYYDYVRPKPPLDDWQSKHSTVAEVQSLELTVRGFIEDDEVEILINRIKLYEYVHYQLTKD